MPYVKRSVGRAKLISYCTLVLILVTLPFVAGPTASASGHWPPPVTGARITAVTRLDDRMLDLAVRSPAMRGTVPVRVILPRSWSAWRRPGYPTLYVLHGGEDDYTSWTRETDIEDLAKDSEALIVMPDGGRNGQYSDWYVGWPRWETFHTRELPRLMEREFRANSTRAVIGLSMGGLGALNYAGRHPGMFRYAASLSGIVDLDDPSTHTFLWVYNALHDNELIRIWGDPARHADIWESHNPSAMVTAYRGTKIHLCAGTGEVGPLDAGRDFASVLASASEGILTSSQERFARSLRAAGVDVTTHVYKPGTHSWPYWKRELHLIWPTVMNELSHQAGVGKWPGHRGSGRADVGRHRVSWSRARQA
ncbi:alpha/beta hydrolase [Streptomyces sp. NPDC051636]|uniref:alpha/beta hydrolase n=1 Tax=Streptomyces sp. NPDC051636 TaxID=3365663 RepID=UPI00378A3669